MQKSEIEQRQILQDAMTLITERGTQTGSYITYRIDDRIVIRFSPSKNYGAHHLQITRIRDSKPTVVMSALKLL